MTVMMGEIMGAAWWMMVLLGDGCWCRVAGGCWVMNAGDR
jgi:hypothetical protein